MIRYIWEVIDNLYGHLLLLIRGCQHPKTEPDGVDHVEISAGVSIAVFYSTCTVCGKTIVSTD